jgi:foldase protein PrsA
MTEKLRTASRLRRASVLLVAVLVAVLAAGCGKSIDNPESDDDAVARVEDEKITKSDFDHWVQSAARSQQPPGGGEVVVPDPPNFTKCIQSKQSQPPPQGAPKPKPEDLKAQCEQEFESLKNQVMQFLVSAEWIEQQAEELDIDASDAEVRQAFTEQKDASFEKDEDYQEFLRTSGQTEADLLFRVRLDLLSQQVRDEIVKDAEKVSEQDIEDNFNENKENYGQPELRDVRVIKTDKREDADKAKGEVQGGAKFGRTARKYSTDQTSKQQGGELADLQKGSGLVPQQAEDAIFGAKKGELQGPVETDQGFYVFEVTAITPGKQPVLDDQTRQQIRSQLESENQQETLDEFVEEFRREFSEKTICAPDYLFPDCDNFKTPADTGPAYGGEPRGAPPIGPPKEEEPAPPASPFGLPTGPGGAPPPQGAPPQGAPPQGAPPQGAPPQGAPPTGP